MSGSNLMNKVLSRKYVLAWMSLLSLNGMLIGSYIDGTLWLTGMIATVGAYMTANLAEAKQDRT